MIFSTPEGQLEFTPERLIIAGWTGRDTSAVRHHIDELALLGVAPPSTTPLFYRVSPSLMTQADSLDVLGEQTSGEVEPLLIRSGGKLWLGLGSDHTDRGLEATSVAHSKQVCGKPISDSLWSVGNKTDFDSIQLKSWAKIRGVWQLYQDGTLSTIWPLHELTRSIGLRDGDAMLCGTLPAIGGIRAADAFKIEMIDPQSGQGINHQYSVRRMELIK
ncbi:MAG: DUF2848 domain-containing protein [Pikeienuella sp.]